MQIVKQGNKQTGDFIGQCRRCGCLIQCKIEELQMTTEYEARRQDFKRFYNCPTKNCNTRIQCKR